MLLFVVIQYVRINYIYVCLFVVQSGEFLKTFKISFMNAVERITILQQQ